MRKKILRLITSKYRSMGSLVSALDSIVSYAVIAGSERQIGYVTDLEGDYDYWKRYLSYSKVLTVSSQNIELREGCHFVFGGDVIDRGPGDLRIVTDLLSLKEKYPSRVHLILGNRDCNKLRLLFALHPNVMKTYPNAYWLRNIADPKLLVLEKDPEYKLDNSISKLKWILKETMGCPKSFELRSQELRQLAQASDDEAVVQSYIDMVSPTGILTRYLSCCQVAAVMGEVMFVHGALHKHNLGYIPPCYAESDDVLQPEKRLSNAIEWANEINKFVKSELKQYMSKSLTYYDSIESGDSLWDITGSYSHPQPGSRLLQYGMGTLLDGTRNPSVIYSSYYVNGKIIPLDESTEEFLSSAGIKVVVVGHQPHGDAPLTVNGQKVQVIAADNSYSKNVLYPLESLLKSFPSATNFTSHGIIATDDDNPTWRGSWNWCTAESPSRNSPVDFISPDEDQTQYSSQRNDSTNCTVVEEFITFNDFQIKYFSKTKSHSFSTRNDIAIQEILITQAADSLLSHSLPKPGSNSLEASVITIRGTLSDGCEYENEVLPVNYNGRYPIGNLFEGDWSIKAVVRSGKATDNDNSGTREDLLLLSRSTGFDFYNKYVPLTSYLKQCASAT